MQELEKILKEIEAEFDRRIDIQLKIMAGLGDDVYRYGYGKSLEAYQQGKLFVEDIIRKYMNDGWIPVEKDLPKNESEVWVVLESTYGTGYRTYSSARYLYFENYGESHWCDNHYGYLEWDKYSDGHGGSSEYKVIAWQPIEPYRPERRESDETIHCNGV